MPRFDSLVLQEQRHLKWRALDPVENVLMMLCGVCISAFSILVLGDVITRAIGRPWLWVQEATMTFFIYGIFIGVAVATRRNDHLYLAVLAESMSGGRRLFFELFNRTVVLGVALCMIYFGFRLFEFSRRL
jgi:TRAP-type C4-dicarboxylate transport system permease small subunit